MTNNENNRKKYGLIPPKIEESDLLSLGHGLCESDGTPNPLTIRTPDKTRSLLALTIIDPATD
jgi:hypothetical protein